MIDCANLRFRLDEVSENLGEIADRGRRFGADQNQIGQNLLFELLLSQGPLQSSRRLQGVSGLDTRSEKSVV